ncbi:hypothetical protein RUND412_002720 [Rhizina undulata]
MSSEGDADELAKIHGSLGDIKTQATRLSESVREIHLYVINLNAFAKKTILFPSPNHIQAPPLKTSIKGSGSTTKSLIKDEPVDNPEEMTMLLEKHKCTDIVNDRRAKLEKQLEFSENQLLSLTWQSEDERKKFARLHADGEITKSDCLRYDHFEGFKVVKHCLSTISAKIALVRTYPVIREGKKG